MVDDEGVRTALAAAAEQMGEELRSITEVRSSHRSSVYRARTASGPVVVKIFDPGSAGEGWVRESAALTVLTRLNETEPGSTAGLVPRLLGTVAEPQIVITADLGAGSSMADALLGSDPERATEAVTSWASTLGRLHAATRTCRADFAGALDQFGEDLHIDVDTTTGMIMAAADALPERAGQLGVEVDATVIAQLRNLASLLEPTHSALTPADACPDNNITGRTGTALVDFESATFRHPAWDLAYLAVPWPTCWCSWRLPPEVADAGLDMWQQAAGFLADDFAALRRDIEIATVGWAFIGVDWFTAVALLDASPWDPDLVTPPRRVSLQHRLSQVSAFEIAELDMVIGFARTLARAMRTAWGEVALPLAPAYRG